MSVSRIWLLLVFLTISLDSNADWKNTGYLNAEEILIHIDNGKTYFRNLPIGPACEHGRLELREEGGYYSNPENAKRMFSLILFAKAQGHRIRLGYNDSDGPACRLSQVYIEE